MPRVIIPLPSLDEMEKLEARLLAELQNPNISNGTRAHHKRALESIVENRRKHARAEARWFKKFTSFAKCKICGANYEPFLREHHIIPVAKNGKSTSANLVTLCANCHALIHEGMSVNVLRRISSVTSLKNYYKRWLKFSEWIETNLTDSQIDTIFSIPNTYFESLGSDYIIIADLVLFQKWEEKRLAVN